MEKVYVKKYAEALILLYTVNNSESLIDITKHVVIVVLHISIQIDKVRCQNVSTHILTNKAINRLSHNIGYICSDFSHPDFIILLPVFFYFYFYFFMFRFV